MPQATERRNTAPWWGLLLALCALGCNAAFFINTSLQKIFPRLSLLLSVVAAIFLVIGLKRAFSRRIAYRGKILSFALSTIALLLAAFAAFVFFGARKLPSADAAPQLGQKVPDFALPDTSGKAVSLDQLLAAFPPPTSSAATPPAAPPASSQPRTPKAVLLIFYRGYW
jgi:hypothetical protein